MSGQRRRMSVFFDFPRCLVFAKCFVLTPSGHADPYIVSAWYPDAKLKFKFSTYYNLVPRYVQCTRAWQVRKAGRQILVL